MLRNTNVLSIFQNTVRKKAFDIKSFLLTQTQVKGELTREQTARVCASVRRSARELGAKRERERERERGRGSERIDENSNVLRSRGS